MTAIASPYALRGDRNELEWLHTHYDPNVFIFREIWLDEDVCSSAAQGGHLNLLQWFRQLGFQLERKYVC